MNTREFAQKHAAEYTAFCQLICDDYNATHLDSLILSDVLWTKYSMDIFYANYLVMR